MMSAPVTTTLDAYHAAVIETLRDTFGDRIQTYGPYDPTELLDNTRPLNTPALYLQLETTDLITLPDGMPLRAHVPARISPVIHVVLSTRTAGDLQVALDVLASAVAVLVSKAGADDRQAAAPGNRWGLGAAVTAPEGIAAIPAEWRPGANGYDSRAVRFEQTLYLPNDPIACLAEPAPAPVEPDPEP